MAAYPRGYAPINGRYGTSEKLVKLHRGYHGLSYTFLFMFLTYIFLVAAIIVGDNSTVGGVLLGIICLACFVTIFYFSIRSCKDIGEGCNWSPIAGLLLGIFTPFIGLIMFVVIQMLAISEMKNYGIQSRAFRGISSKEIKAKIEELRSLEQSSSGSLTA